MSTNADWAELPFFLAIARTGSLRAAAMAAGGTHATVNRRLAALEASYGVRLFDRSRQGLTLTEAGRALIPLAETAEEAVIGARARLMGLDREAAGRVRVSIPLAIADDIMAPVFADFCASHPGIELNVAVTDRMENINRLETDVSVRIAYEVADDVTGRRLVRTAMAIYASRAYLAGHFARRGDDGEGLTWLGWEENRGGSPAWVRSSPFPRAAIRHAVADTGLQVHLVRRGLGMAYLPCMAAHFHADLVQVPGTMAEASRSIWLLLHSDLQRTRRVRLFVDHVAAALKSRRAVFQDPRQGRPAPPL